MQSAPAMVRLNMHDVFSLKTEEKIKASHTVPPWTADTLEKLGEQQLPL